MNVRYLNALKNHCDRMVVGYTTTCSIGTTISPRILCRPTTFFLDLLEPWDKSKKKPSDGRGISDCATI